MYLLLSSEELLYGLLAPSFTATHSGRGQSQMLPSQNTRPLQSTPLGGRPIQHLWWPTIRRPLRGGRRSQLTNISVGCWQSMYLHPHFEGSSSDILFPNRDGRPLDHLSRHVEKLANKLGICLPHTATETRHAAATAIAEGTDKERTAVAAAMSHSQRTQQLYYSLKKGRKEAVEGYRVMEGIRRGAEGREAGGARKGFSVEETVDCFLLTTYPTARHPHLQSVGSFWPNTH